MILLILGVTNVLSNPSPSCATNLRITEVQSVTIEKNGTCVISFNSDKGSIKFDKGSKENSKYEEENSYEVPKNLSFHPGNENYCSIPRNAAPIHPEKESCGPLHLYTDNPTGSNNFRHSDGKSPLVEHSFNNSSHPKHLNTDKEEEHIYEELTHTYNKGFITPHDLELPLPKDPKNFPGGENLEFIKKRKPKKEEADTTDKPKKGVKKGIKNLFKKEKKPKKIKISYIKVGIPGNQDTVNTNSNTSR